MIEDHWAHAMSRLIRIEMARLGWSYGDLLAGLDRVGVTGESVPNLRNKVARGTFSAVFLAQAMLAMDVKEVRLDGREIAEARTKPTTAG